MRTQGKKALLVNALSYLYNFVKKKHIKLVFLEAFNKTQFAHFENVISKLSEYEHLRLFLISPDIQLSQTSKIKTYSSVNDIPLYLKPDIFISTDLNRIPHWYICPTVYFGHGMGPKLNYVAREDLTAYNYAFSPCKPTFAIQKNFLGENNTFTIGMPILDKNSNKIDIKTIFNLDSQKPTILYAPSWCINIEKVSNITKIIKYLEGMVDFNIIISPHPLLFLPERCGGKAFFNSAIQTKHIHINTPDTSINTLDIAHISEIVLSDISSILFEAMALGKKTCFDGNRDLYEYSEALSIFEQLIDICPIPNWEDNQDKTFDDLLQNNVIYKKQQVFINDYLFNNGNATEAFVEATLKILKYKSSNEY